MLLRTYLLWFPLRIKKCHSSTFYPHLILFYLTSIRLITKATSSSIWFIFSMRIPGRVNIQLYSLSLLGLLKLAISLNALVSISPWIFISLYQIFLLLFFATYCLCGFRIKKKLVGIINPILLCTPAFLLRVPSLHSVVILNRALHFLEKIRHTKKQTIS